MDRKTIKQYAKEKIKNNLLTAYLVGLIPSLAGFCDGIFRFTVIKQEYSSSIDSNYELMISVGTSLFYIFVTYLILSFFMKNSKEKAEFHDMVDGLEASRYFDFIKVNLVVFVKTFLWSLLFIIPGIIKSLEYIFVPYIKISHPEYTTKECFEISRQMTSGRKFDIFILQLSFIGWVILSTLTLGLVLPFTVAYQNQALADLYYDISGE